ncbi:unnamed protein product [Caenorhabditis sp. 36 PRJEB53466]|nr:unnamed protein product [Caenorhabditis sp. 36 PRJEB53466]
MCVYTRRNAELIAETESETEEHAGLHLISENLKQFVSKISKAITHTAAMWRGAEDDVVAGGDPKHIFCVFDTRIDQIII